MTLFKCHHINKNDSYINEVFYMNNIMNDKHIRPDAAQGPMAFSMVRSVSTAKTIAEGADRVFYFDMDGCLAKWGTVPVWRTKEPGFYLSRQPEQALIRALTILKEKGTQVAILSKAYTNGYAGPEKIEWLQRNGLGGIRTILVPYGSSKLDYILSFGEAVVISDFSEELHECERAGVQGVKFYNGLNGNHGTWHGPYITYLMNEFQIVNALSAL